MLGAAYLDQHTKLLTDCGAARLAKYEKIERII